MIYVPVFRYRQEERKVILQTNFSTKCMPLIEIVKEKPKKNMVKSFQAIHGEELAHINVPFMLDFPMDLPITRQTKDEVANFLRPIQTAQPNRIRRFSELQGIQNLIPVISYNPRIQLSQGYIKNETQALRAMFPRLAFRIYVQNFNIALSAVTSQIHAEDIIILDLGEAPHGNPGLQSIYSQIINLGRSHNCLTVIIRSAIPTALTNTSLVDNHIIVEADNSLLSTYSRYGFSSFGDYVGVKKDNITDGGTISPGFIFYSWQDNCYVGYKYSQGMQKQLSEFETHITPMVMGSTYWGTYTAPHHGNCPGCTTIARVANGSENGKSQAKWKGICMMHYLYTMEEFL